MMIWANVTEDELKEKKEIQTTFGETFHGIIFAMQEKILLYGKSQRTFCMVKKIFTSYGTILEFVQRTNSTLSIMKNGEHWFHTDEQMKFLDEWIIKSSK